MAMQVHRNAAVRKPRAKKAQVFPVEVITPSRALLNEVRTRVGNDMTRVLFESSNSAIIFNSTAQREEFIWRAH